MQNLQKTAKWLVFLRSQARIARRFAAPLGRSKSLFVVSGPVLFTIVVRAFAVQNLIICPEKIEEISWKVRVL